MTGIYFTKLPKAVIPGAILALALSFFAGVGPAIAKEKISLTVAMSLTPLSSPVIIAEDQGFFTKNGIDVKIKDVIGGNRALKAVFNAQADIATSSEAVVMFNSFKRDDFAVIATFVTSDNDVKIITRKNTGIRSIRDLVNKKVGTVMGASAQFFLDQTLLLAGIDGARVNVVHINPEDAPGALKKGDVDVIVVWEPLAYLARKKLADNAVVVAHEKVYTETFNAVILKSFAAANPALLEKFIRALLQATDFINHHPQRSQSIVAKRIKKDIEFIRSVWKDFDFTIGLNQWLITTLEKQARWAISHRLVKETKIPNYLDYLNLPPLERVHSEAITVYH